MEALRDHLPDVLAGLDRWAAEDAVTTALRQAELLEARGDHELAATLRAAAAEATAKAAEAVLSASQCAVQAIDSTL